jgi:hypothetical protein
MTTAKFCDQCGKRREDDRTHWWRLVTAAMSKGYDIIDLDFCSPECVKTWVGQNL